MSYESQDSHWLLPDSHCVNCASRSLLLYCTDGDENNDMTGVMMR